MTIEFDHWIARVEHELSRKNQRLTPQRRVIAEALFHDGVHRNVDELYQLVRDRDRTVGHATVYRTMKLLQELDLVSANNFADGSARYEVAGAGDAHHDHLVCRTCDHIVEFEDDQVERLQEAIATRLGFVLRDHRMVLFGDCVRQACPNRQTSNLRRTGPGSHATR